jgi:hypothetical protein
MPEYDPFGRPIEPGGPTVGVGSEEPRAEPTQAPKPHRRGIGAGLGCMASLVAVAVVIGVVATGLVSTVGDSASELREAFEGLDGEIDPPAADRLPREAPSALTPRGLRRTVGFLREDVPGRLRLLRIDRAGRVDVQVVRNGDLSIAQLAARGTETRVFATQPATGALRTFPYDAVRPDAPRTLIRAASKRLRAPARRVDYLVALRTGAALEWLVFFEGGRSAAGDARGRLTRVVNGP